MLSEAILSGIAEAVISYALEQSGLADHLRTALGRDPVKRAFAKALGDACRATEETEPALAGKLFNESFLRHEATPVLDQLLWRHGRPKGDQLAGAWADSLRLQGRLRDEALSEMTPAAEQTAENTSKMLAVLEERLPSAAGSRPLGPVPTPIPNPRAERLVGRDDELEWLCERLRAGNVAAVAALRGIGGIGKTELAIAAARRLEQHLEGRVVWLECGPNDIQAIQEHMASALGIVLPEASLAVRADALHQAWRARSPTLVVLDDLRRRHLGDYAHLVPPSPPCALLITTRRTDLQLPPGAILPLPDLKPADSVELLALLLPAGWVQAEPEAAAQIAELLEHVPLSLALAASRGRAISAREAVRAQVTGKRAAAPAATPLALLLAELRARRLEVLNQGEDPARPDLSVVITFNASYDELDEPDRARLRRLGIFARNEFDLPALRSVWGNDQASARQAVQRLVNAGLVEEIDDDTWWMHDQLREYAAVRLTRADAGEYEAARLAHAVYWAQYLDVLEPRSLQEWKTLDACGPEVERAASWLLGDWHRAPEQTAELAVAIASIYQPYTWPQWEPWMAAGLAGRPRPLDSATPLGGSSAAWRSTTPSEAR